MEHVGWRDVSSALRYVDVSQNTRKSKFERGLAAARRRRRRSAAGRQVATIHLRLLLTKPGGSRRGAVRSAHSGRSRRVLGQVRHAPDRPRRQGSDVVAEVRKALAPVGFSAQMAMFAERLAAGSVILAADRIRDN